MPAYSFKKAKASSLITEKDYERIACMFLSMADQVKPTGKQYELAAAEFGNTKASFQVRFAAFLKKLRDNNCYVEGADEAEDADAAPATPKAKSKKGGSKRKAADDKGSGEGEESPKKARGAKQNSNGAVKTEEV